MSEDKRDYEVGRGKPPVHTRFKKGQSGNPRGPRPKNLPALLLDALNEKVVVTIDGERREITKRGDRHSAGQQIDSSRFARDQDADRHDEGCRKEDRSRAAARTVSVHPDGQGGGQRLRGAGTPSPAAGSPGPKRGEPGSRDDFFTFCQRPGSAARRG